MPEEFLLKIEPGVANISRFCSKANLAVIRAPLFSGASITIVAKQSPLIILFRQGKYCFRAGAREYSGKHHFYYFLTNFLLVRGKIFLILEPRIAIVFRFSKAVL